MGFVGTVLKAGGSVAVAGAAAAMLSLGQPNGWLPFADQADPLAAAALSDEEVGGILGAGIDASHSFAMGSLPGVPVSFRLPVPLESAGGSCAMNHPYVAEFSDVKAGLDSALIPADDAAVASIENHGVPLVQILIVPAGEEGTYAMQAGVDDMLALCGEGQPIGDPESLPRTTIHRNEENWTTDVVTEYGEETLFESVAYRSNYEHTVVVYARNLPLGTSNVIADTQLGKLENTEMEQRYNSFPVRGLPDLMRSWRGTDVEPYLFQDAAEF